MTATKSDDRLQKVQSFEIGKTYGGFTVEGRTACFVTFNGQSRKKISIVDGVEQVKFDATERRNGAGKVIESRETFTIAAFEEPSDAEIYAPVATDDGSIVITDGATDWKLMAINNDEICSLVPVDESKDPDGRTVRLVALQVLQAIIAKPSVAPQTQTKVNAVKPVAVEQPVVAPKPEVSNFWTACKVAIVPDFKPETVAAYKSWATGKTNELTFNVGQTYEDNNGFQFKVTSRTGDTIELNRKHILNVSVCDCGEFVQLGSDRSSRFYAADTPSWFYDRDRELIRDFHFDRIRDREDADADRQGCI